MADKRAVTNCKSTNQGPVQRPSHLAGTVVKPGGSPSHKGRSDHFTAQHRESVIALAWPGRNEVRMAGGSASEMLFSVGEAGKASVPPTNKDTAWPRAARG
jgi:hypothetical protein